MSRFFSALAGNDGARVWLVLYAALVLPLGIVLAAIVPPGQVADEPTHAVRASSVAHGQLLGYRQAIPPDGAVVAGVDGDPALAWVMFAFRTDEQKTATAEAASRAAGIEWVGTTSFVHVGAIASYFPIFYVPAATVIAIAPWLGLKPLSAILIARFANLAAATLLGAAALLTARRGRGLLFCILAFPMTVSLTASLNPDGLMIGTSVLVAALLTRQHRGDVAAPSFGVAAAGLLCIGLAKPPFLPMAAMLLAPLPPIREWFRPRRSLLVRLGTLLLVALLVMAWADLAATHALALVPRPAYEAGPLWPGARPAIFNGVDPAAQAEVVAAHPGRIFLLSWYALLHSNLVEAMIGVLGWLNVFLPSWLYALWKLAAVAAIVGELVGPVGAERPPAWLDIALLVAGCTLALFAICFSQYLTWTPVGATRVDGLQGRYLLPLLPLLIVVLPRFGVPGGRFMRWACLAMPVAAAAAGLIAIPPLIVLNYYLR